MTNKETVLRGLERNGVQEAVLSAGLNITGTAIIPERAATHSPVPTQIHESVQRWIRLKYPAGIYSHQARAIELAIEGKDVCLSTSTSSGKSLAFMSLAAHRITSNPGARVLAIYPARALIQDQQSKWKSAMAPFGIKCGVIDGSVATDLRTGIINSSGVVLMTPDVMHAWLMSNTGTKGVRGFLDRLRMLILDEAHVYDGVFGTNMAYLMRRFDSVAAPYELFCCTATLGQPEDFIQQLTGRIVASITSIDDGSHSPERSVICAKTTVADSFGQVVRLIKNLDDGTASRFIAFADSRLAVEQLVAALHRKSLHDPDEGGPEQTDKMPTHQDSGVLTVLPYRAGYEDEDRAEIQRSLEAGTLHGVVSTSALELGLDIGDMDLALMVSVPPTMKAFWQRAGRAGRRRPGVCLIVDSRGIIADGDEGLATYLQRPIEPSWIYMDNRYIQYANAMCAAAETSDRNPATGSNPIFQTLPDTFRHMLANEINPTESIPPDLYPLKQRGQSSPHFEFPLRSAAEATYQIRGSFNKALGNLSFSQLMREGYPGAIYYYMAVPYRVTTVMHRDAIVRCKPEKSYTTKPRLVASVFPNFETGILNLRASANGFVAETTMQVSERISGFTETRGSARETFEYGPGSPYSQKPLTRFFETTGICWWMNPAETLTDDFLALMLEAFCVGCGIQSRDVGIGRFRSKSAPGKPDGCQGVCIFDATNGSLRLTEALMVRFLAVLRAAGELCSARGDDGLQMTVNEATRSFQSMTTATPNNLVPAEEEENDWAIVIGPNERAMLSVNGNQQEVTVRHHRFGPQGLMYELEPKPHTTRWSVVGNNVLPINGETQMVRVNLLTGEVEA